MSSWLSSGKLGPSKGHATVATCCPSGLGRHSLLVSKPSLPKRILSHFLSLVDIGSIPVDMLSNSYTMNIEYLFFL